MEVTSIVIFGIKILEPAASITDLIVSAVCFYAYIKLKKLNRSDKAFIYFNYFFLTMGIATFLGGVIGHAFLYAFSFAWKLPGWIMSMISIALLERASIKHSKKFLHPVVEKSYAVVNIIELTIVMTITFITLDFFFVEIHSGFGLLAVILPVQLYIYIKTKNNGSKLFLIGIGFAILSAIVFKNQISLHKWFDHIALSHLIMSGGIYVFYKATYFIKSK